MNAIDFLKTDNNEIISILKKIENRFIIEKDNDVSCRIFFDYDKDHRIEIKSKSVIYHIKKENLTILNDKLYPDNLEIYGDNTVVNENNLILGSLISDGSNIGIINKIEKNTKVLDISVIYASTPVVWKDLR